MPLELPLGEEEALHGIADVLTDQGFEYEPDGQHHTEPLPADVADEEHRLHDELVEEIVSGDDEQLERYLSGDVPTAAELERTLAHELLDQLEFPVLCGSALTGVGVDRLADFICELGPSPADRPTSVAAGNGDGSVTVDVPADPAGKPLAYVFKTVADQFVGQVSLFKVLSGTVAVDERLVSSASGTEERMHGLFHLRGKDHLTTDRIVAGDIGAVAKLSRHPHRHDARAQGLAGARRPARSARRPSSAWPSSRSRRPTTTSCRRPCSGCSPRTRAWPSTATRRPARPCCAAAATPTSPSRSSAWPASSASTSRPRTCGCRTARRSSARPRPRARSRSSPAATASTPSPTCG